MPVSRSQKVRRHSPGRKETRRQSSRRRGRDRSPSTPPSPAPRDRKRSHSRTRSRSKTPPEPKRQKSDHTADIPVAKLKFGGKEGKSSVGAKNVDIEVESAKKKVANFRTAGLVGKKRSMADAKEAPMPAVHPEDTLGTSENKRIKDKIEKAQIRQKKAPRAESDQNGSDETSPKSNENEMEKSGKRRRSPKHESIRSEGAIAEEVESHEQPPGGDIESTKRRSESTRFDDESTVKSSAKIKKTRLRHENLRIKSKDSGSDGELSSDDSKKQAEPKATRQSQSTAFLPRSLKVTDKKLHKSRKKPHSDRHSPVTARRRQQTPEIQKRQIRSPKSEFVGQSWRGRGRGRSSAPHLDRSLPSRFGSRGRGRGGRFSVPLKGEIPLDRMPGHKTSLVLEQMPYKGRREELKWKDELGMDALGRALTGRFRSFPEFFGGGRDKEKFTLFFTKAFVFSNHQQCELQLDGHQFNCTEQYYMWAKAKAFRDDRTAARILASKDPREQKQLGRSVRHFDQQIWEPIGRYAMFRANHEKYTRHEYLLRELFGTDGTTLVETNPNDVIWGIGYGHQHPLARERTEWRGENWLGEMLTILREKLKLDEKYRNVYLDVRETMRRKKFIGS